jgi:hypothetical protein
MIKEKGDGKMMTTRKEFLGGMLASAAAGCAGIPWEAVNPA